MDERIARLKRDQDQAIEKTFNGLSRWADARHLGKNAGMLR
jgi:hypothetical protein